MDYKEINQIKRYSIKREGNLHWLIDNYENKKIRNLLGNIEDSFFFCDMLNILFEQMTHDPLTNTYNRRFLELFATTQLAKPNIYIALVDINKLKDINDTLGHIAGDEMIVKVANILKEFGFVVRYGGDEFLVILDNDVQVDRFKVVCTEQDFFSYGIAKKTEDISFEEAMNTADSIMYANKTFREKNENKKAN